MVEMGIAKKAMKSPESVNRFKIKSLYNSIEVLFIVMEIANYLHHFTSMN